MADYAGVAELVDAPNLELAALDKRAGSNPAPGIQHNHYTSVSRVMKSGDTRGVPRPGDKIHIPLKTDDALRVLLKVKPTKDMPRPGAQKVGQRKQHWVKNGKPACGAAVTGSRTENVSEVTCQSCRALLAREDLLKQQVSVSNRKR